MFILKDLYKTIGWWYWLATIPMLVAGVTGQVEGIYLAIGLTGIQFVHYYGRHKKISAFPVQVRIGYIILLVSGLWVPLFWIHWIQLIGTSALVLFGYCPLARILSLMPWNRQNSFSWGLFFGTFFSVPVAGSVQNKPAAS